MRSRRGFCFCPHVRQELHLDPVPQMSVRKGSLLAKSSSRLGTTATTLLGTKADQECSRPKAVQVLTTTQKLLWKSDFRRCRQQFLLGWAGCQKSCRF